MPMWNMHERTTDEQARKNRGRSNYGKTAKVEDTTPLDDAYDVAIGLAGSGVVYDSTFPNSRTGGSG